jgi:hypothetical protein
LLGLEYIGRVYELSYTDIANKIGVTPQYIQSGVKLDKDGKPRRNFSQSILDKLYEVFRLPGSYYQKVLTRVEELDVQIMYLHSQLETVESESEHITLSEEIEKLSNEQEVLMLLENTEEFLRDEFEYYEQILSNLNLLFRLRSKKRIIAIYTMLQILNKEIREIGEPIHHSLEVNDELMADFKELLIKHNVLDDLKLIKDKIGFRIEVEDQIKNKELLDE